MSTSEIEQGGKAIEVATMLGESVVDVKHCMDPKSGKITPRTWALFATAALCMLVSGIAFYVSVSTAAYNQAGRHYWTQVANKPAYSYRPEALSAGFDWLAFGGFGLGIVALGAALLRMRDEKQSPYYRIGTAPGVEQPLEAAPAPSFPLVSPTENQDDFVFNFSPGMTGEAIIDGRTMPLAELAASGRARPSAMVPGAYELPLALQSRIRANVGKASFLVAAVAKPRRHTSPLLAGVQSRTMSYFVGSLGAHLALVLLLSQLPVDAGAATVDMRDLEMVSIDVSGTVKDDVIPDPDDNRDFGAGGEDTGGAHMKLESGTAGTDKTTRTDGKIRIKHNNADPQLARVQALEMARNAGFLGSSSALMGAAFASLDSHSDIASGFDSVDRWGAIYGSDGESVGNFGYGLSGFGKGGGCTIEPCGTLGTGPGYGEIGLGKFGKGGWGPDGMGGLGIRKRESAVPRPTIGQPTGVGDLDKSIIRRYIKQNIDKIGYCYEKQLLAKPGMHGTVTVSFFITPGGSVTGSVGAGMDATVANCVADVIGAIQFPKPKNGGGVQVNYPFTFHPAGAGQ